MERAKFLNAHAYERTKKRNGYANGFKITKSMRSVFSSNSKEEAKVVLKNAIKYWEIDKKHINFENWLEKNVEDSLTYFEFHEFGGQK